MRGGVVLVIAILAVGILTVPWPGEIPAVGEREVVVRARQYSYAPGILHVRQRDRVTLVLESDDVTHGLYLDGYDVDLVAVPGRASRTTFVADRPGKFRLRCSKICGTLHPFMLGEMVVTPNSPFWRAIGLAILAAIGTLAFLWAGRRESGEVSA